MKKSVVRAFVAFALVLGFGIAMFVAKPQHNQASMGFGWIEKCPPEGDYEAWHALAARGGSCWAN
jgi:hypothetical protein